MVANPVMAEKMSYHGQHHHAEDEDEICDVFDGRLYKELLGQRVTVDGTQSAHTYFSDKRDIALGLSSDGFSPFKNQKLSALSNINYDYVCK
jgi:hypothetical protein